MHTQTPFKAKLHNGRIILSGAMTCSQAVRQECERISQLAVQTGSQFVVDAQDVTLWDGGENAWSEVVQEFLGHCQLIYLPSSLALSLQYDVEYGHKKTRFLDTDNELRGCGSGSCPAAWDALIPRAAASC